MNNAASLHYYEEKLGDEIPLAPVIPIKSVTRESKDQKNVSVIAGVKKSIPDFTEPVFKPKKHDMF